MAATSSYRVTVRIPTGVVTWSVLLGLAAAIAPLLMTGGGIHAWAYDTGVYFGASVRLVHGVLPYRDFDLMHPPGIALLLSPISFLSYFVSTSSTVVLARLATIACMGANAGLVARLVRHKGKVAAFCGGGFLALYSASAGSDTVVMLEPFLVLFCLLAFRVAFDEGALSTPRRAWWAGVLLGIAGLIKIWAFFVLLPLAIVYFIIQRSSLPRLLGGAVTAFTLGALPFLVAAPRSFVRDIFTSQVLRTNGTIASPTLLMRLRLASFLLWRALCPSYGAAAVVGVIILGGAIALLAIRRQRLSALDIAALVSVVCISLSLATASEFYSYYVYFLAPFIALLVAFAISQCAAGLRRVLTGKSSSVASGVKAAVALVLAIALVAFSLASWHASEATTSQRGPTPALSFIDRAIPVGSCVTSNNPVFLLLANRFVPSDSHCPAVVDPFGLWLALDPQHPQPSPALEVPQVTMAWQKVFAASPYVLLDLGLDYLIPWTPALLAWFNHHFVVVARQGGLVVYVNIAH